MQVNISLLLLSLSLGFGFNAAADLALPDPIRADQNLKVTMGECQADWSTVLGDSIARTFDLGRNVTLWLVPCARWSTNDNWSAYLTVKESSRPEGYITKPLFFVGYSLNQKLRGESVIHNPIFNPSDLSLESTYYPQDFGYCKSAARFVWHPGHQTFLLESLLKKDDCHNASTPMEPVYP